MSEISDRIGASIYLADYANVDAAGKTNILGAGIRVAPIPDGAASTLPLTVLVTLETPLPTTEQPALEIVLTTASGDPVEVELPGQPRQAVRFAQIVSFQVPSIGTSPLPAGAVPSTANVILSFPTGLPLAKGQSYQWRVQVDHDILASYSFYVPNSTVPPVWG